ncbi:MAG: GNAT family N-acetyltransferase [Trueperaceae bacterium]
MSTSAILRRLEDAMRMAFASARTVVSAEGFTLYLTPGAGAPYLSAAVPNETAPAGWAHALAGLPAAFAAHGSTARIEMFAELQPELLEAADEGGWRRSMVVPVMTLTPEAFSNVPEPTPVGTYRPLDPADGARLEAILRAQHRAFGGDGEAGALDWLPSLERGLRDGTLLGGAIDAGGVPVAGAVVLLGGDAGELAGVWTEASFRGQGYASRVCHEVLRAAFDEGLPLAWLSAAEGALRIYERLGFARVGTQVNLEQPG